MQSIDKKPQYGNWVSSTLIRKFALLFFVCALAAAALFAFVSGCLPLKIILASTAVLLIICTVYFIRAKWLFAPKGKNIQNKVIDELLSRVDWDGNGRALEIGCGSGALTIRLAKKYPLSQVDGIDYWGNSWGYSRTQCEENARLEGVGNRTNFQRASASKLPFADESFDLVVSNLTFHEVNDSKNKLDIVREALRVVKKGGRFVFQDLFLIRRYYGTPDELTAAMEAMGGTNLRFVNTCEAPFIPRSLKLPFMIGTLSLICGNKE